METKTKVFYCPRSHRLVGVRSAVALILLVDCTSVHSCTKYHHKWYLQLYNFN